jgi:putative tricarboxylic transport membrane protein
VSGEGDPVARQRLGTAAFCAIAFMVFAGVFVGSGSFSPDASLFPRLIAAVAMVSAGFAFVHSFREGIAGPGDADPAEQPASRRDIAISYAGPPLYCALMVVLGFWLSSAIFLAGLLVMLGTRRVAVVLSLVIGTLSLIYVAFELVFGIALPTGMLFDATGS